MDKKRVIITGATGMVGGCALKICLQNPDVSMVTAIGRRLMGIEHDKLQEVLVEDFSDYSAMADAMATMENQDGALFCLGV
jgi:dihydrodipicolinate reductase